VSVKLSLTAKSLLLVSIPLLFEVGFVWALVNLQHETEVEAQQAICDRDISQNLGTISSKIYRLWNIVSIHHHKGTDDKLAISFFNIYRSSFLPLLTSLSDDYKRLAELTRDRPKFVANVQKSSSALFEIRSILDNAFSDMKSGHIELVAERYQSGADRIVDLFGKISQENFAMVAVAEHDSAEMSSRRHSTFRQLMIGFVLFTCAFNAAFCALLAVFLVKGIVSRLSVMSDNARRLAANQPLNQQIAGHDEIAELDKVFHNMAATIEETARMRQELVSMLTHDLRSPLTAIQGSLELLDMELEKTTDEREKRLVDVAQRNSSRMMRLINDLLDIHKLKEGMMTFAPTEVCLAEVFEDVALSVSSWIEDSSIRLKYGDTDLFVYAEREKVERIIFNLVANAIKYSPHAGTITITTKNEGRMARISVSDQGIGIPADQLQSIFERFQQVVGDEKQSAGSGLGLTICQYLVHLQGGEIWVDSEVGKGSTFYFTLPLG
jgi:signal transduction histidine kinase